MFRHKAFDHNFEPRQYRNGITNIMEQPIKDSDAVSAGDVVESNAPTAVVRFDDPPVHERHGAKRKRILDYGGISVKSLNFGIPTQRGTYEFVKEHDGHQSWRMKIIDFLHQPRVTMVSNFLLLLDVIVLFVELFLLTQYPMCFIIERDCISCCPPESTHDDAENDFKRFLSGGGDALHEDVCDSGLEPNYNTGGCDQHKWGNIHNVELALFSITISILCIFFVELSLEMIALRPSVFFRQFFYALDYAIVTVSLVLEMTLYFVGEEGLAALLGLLIFARIWRFFRIGHGIVEVTSELTHKKYETLLEYTRALEEAAIKSAVEMPQCPEEVRLALSEDGPSHSHHGSS